MKNEGIFISLGFWKYFILSFFFIFISFSTLYLVKVDAISGTYEKYDVDVNINEDSSMDVTESVVTRWTGEFHYINRDLTLINQTNLQKCKSDSSLQCGGFSFVKIIGVYDGDGKLVPENQLEMGTTSDSNGTYLSVKWNFAPNGRTFNNEEFRYNIKYKVYGGLGYFDTYDLFYWNMLPGTRPSAIDSSNMNIIFPKTFTFTKSDLRIISSLFGADLNSSFDSVNNTIKITAANIASNSDFTVLYKFPKGIIQKYASLKLTTSPDPVDVSVNDISVGEVSKNLSGLLPGTNKLVFSASGYKSTEISVDLAPGEVKELNVVLEKSLLTIVLEAINILGACVGCLTLPLGLFLIYRKWSTTGKDKGVKRTIIPEYSPPEGMPSYLVGSLKDEKVDLIDITSSIIDLAYRGYLKIREYTSGKILGFGGSKEYEFTKLKEDAGLTPAEKELFKGLFSSADKTTLEDLKYKFYKNIPTIRKDIYDEMVEKEFFKESPDKVRNRYIGNGVGLVVLSILPFCAIGPLFFISFVLLTFAVSMFINGIALLVIANFMPAKTEKGLRTFEKIQGFRMYMYTAERFRVQDLTPETFEKYLSYAICFKIETKWAERFKDIYKSAPDWFQSDDMTTFNTVYLINSLNSFNVVSASALTSTYQSSGSSSGGGGWSGGGGFSGGFSGGGGGGGGSGWG